MVVRVFYDMRASTCRMRHGPVAYARDAVAIPLSRIRRGATAVHGTSDRKGTGSKLEWGTVVSRGRVEQA